MKTILSSRRDRYLARLSIFLITVALITGIVGCTEPVFQIKTWYDLDAVRENLGDQHILMNDLDSTSPGYAELASEAANQGEGWQPIGVFDPYDYDLRLAFTGTFDGQKYEIRDLFIDRPAQDEMGLFGYVAEGGVVENVSVVNATVTGERYVGGLVALDSGIVRSCYSTGKMAGDWWVGGLVGGIHDGTVTNCHSFASVDGHEGEVGGLAGRNWGTISNSYSTGSVTCEWRWAGGLVGDNRGTVTNSYSTGSVTGDEDVGGLVGGHEVVAGTVSNSYYNYGEVLINGENIITAGALFAEDFEEWLANGKFLDVNERLAQENGYYVINNVSDFKQLLAFGQNNTLKFKLKKDLDLGGEPNFYIPYFAGEFDGNSHVVSNLSFDFDFVSQVGLFGYLAGGKARGVGVENVNITGYGYVGGLVGYNREGILSNCYSSGNVTGDEVVGGLVGENYGGTVSNSCSSGSVTGGSDVGGLLGYNREGTVSSSYSTASVSGDRWVGGLVGTVLPTGAVSNSYSSGSVTGDEYVGGLVGSNVGTVSTSFWDTETSGQATSDGGTGKTTAEMQDIATFSGAAWDITAVANPSTRNPSYIWNIVDHESYPFLSWES